MIPTAPSSRCSSSTRVGLGGALSPPNVPEIAKIIPGFRPGRGTLDRRAAQLGCDSALFTQLCGLTRAVSVLVVDDVQRLDDATRRMFERLIWRDHGSPNLFLGDRRARGLENAGCHCELSWLVRKQPCREPMLILAPEFVEDP